MEDVGKNRAARNVVIGSVGVLTIVFIALKLAGMISWS
jgi:hypothetical protein